MIVWARREETVETLIWRTFGRLDAGLDATVLDDARTAGVEAALLIEPGQEVWLPDTVTDATPPALIRSAEIWI